jgi:serine/threonine protein phosphatase 1
MISGLLNRLFAGQTRPEPDRPFPPLAPIGPFLAVGDIHGQISHLDRMLDLLDRDYPDVPIILVGDYIDRGEDSAAVLERIMDLSSLSGSRLICLAGNHEDMCLKFLDDPEAHAPLWLRNGGLQTLASFGVGGIGQSTRGAELARARDELALSMGDDLINWMAGLPTHWQSGNVVVLHAGADPAQPIADQKRSTLLWGHKDFAKIQRRDGIWVIHGHTIVPEPVSEKGRIAIDTGAYATGRLTSVLIDDHKLQFISA